jgi:Raf kinase inhibitor-like YbhB/YbcL family protein
VVVIALLSALASCQKQGPGPTVSAPPSGDSAETPEQIPENNGTTEDAEDMDWRLSSSAFDDGADIPSKYTCSGADVSPPLTWTAPPEGCVELALICDDPDAPRGEWVHWVIYGIGADVGELPEELPKDGKLTEPVAAIQGENDSLKIGYNGPCPPPGPAHRYVFKLYALNEKVNLEPGATKAELLMAMEGKIAAKARLTGKFGR